MSESTQPKERHCVKCGKNMMWDANVCPYCGHDYRRPVQTGPPMMQPMVMMPPLKPKSSVPLVAGALNMVTAALGLISALLVIIVADEYGGLLSGFTGLIGIDITAIIMIFGLIGIIMSVLVLLASVFMLKRTHFGFAIVGAIFGMILVGPFTFYFIGCALSFLAIILLAVSHKEFD